MEWTEIVDSIISTPSSPLPITIPAFASPPGSTFSPSPLEAHDRLKLVVIKPPIVIEQPDIDLPTFCQYMSARFDVWRMRLWLHNNIILQAIDSNVYILPFEAPPIFSTWVASIFSVINLYGIHVPLFDENHGAYVPLPVIDRVFRMRPIAARHLLYWANGLKLYIRNDMPNIPPLLQPEQDNTELQTVLAFPARNMPLLRHVFDTRLI